MPSGRIAKLNWTPSFGQYTVTINKKLYRLGTDKTEAEKQFRFLQTKTDMAEEITAVPTFGEVAEAWLLHIETIHDQNIAILERCGSPRIAGGK